MNSRYFTALYACFYLAAVNNFWDKTFSLGDIFTDYTGGITPSECLYLAESFSSSYGSFDDLYPFESIYGTSDSNIKIKFKKLTFSMFVEIMEQVNNNKSKGNLPGKNKEDFIFDSFLLFWAVKNLNSKDMAVVALNKAKEKFKNQEDVVFWENVYSELFWYIDFLRDFF